MSPPHIIIKYVLSDSFGIFLWNVIWCMQSERYMSPFTKMFSTQLAAQLNIFILIYLELAKDSSKWKAGHVYFKNSALKTFYKLKDLCILHYVLWTFSHRYLSNFRKVCVSLILNPGWKEWPRVTVWWSSLKWRYSATSLEQH